MAMTPRLTETVAVERVLESGEYDTARQMAGAVVKTVAELIQGRDGRDGTGLYMVTLEGAPVGPFYTAGDAERWRDWAAEDLGLRGRVLRLWTPTSYTVAEKVAAMGTGCACGHEKEQHVEKKRRTDVRYAECGVWNKRDRAWCGCGGYERKA